VRPWSAIQRLSGIPPGELHQLALLASPRHAKVDGTAAPVGQIRLQVFAVGRRQRHENLARDRRRTGIELAQVARDDLLVGHVARRLEEVDVPADELPVPDGEQLDGGLAVLPGQPDEIQLGPGEGRHLLRLHRPLDGADLVAKRGRSLELELPGGVGHLGAERDHQRLLPALEEQLHLGDVRPVGRPVDRLDAGTLAALDVIEQAGPLQGALALADVDRAGPEREQPPDEVHGLVHARGGGIRAEVAAAVVGQLARPLHAREVVGQGDLDVRVALVVLEPDVEARPVALDEVRLEQQRLRDRVGERVLDVDNLVDDGADPLRVGTRRRPLLPVAPDAIAQALRLADVQHLVPGVLHQVDARTVGQLGEDGGQLRGHARHRRPTAAGRAAVTRRC
jgi:hypothetical protein